MRITCQVKSYFAYFTSPDFPIFALMEQYTYEDQYKGKPRKLLILFSPGAEEYRIFCDSNFLGSIRPVESADQEIKWKTEYNILKPIADKIGIYIMSLD